MPKTILILSDFHTAHEAGLNPPEFHHPLNHPHGCGPVQRELFAGYQIVIEQAKKLSPSGEIDYTFHLGDFVDGKAERTGGTECLIPDQVDAANAAGDLLLMTGARHYVMIHGTPAHDGRDNDFADVVYERVSKEIGEDRVELHNSRYVQVEGLLYHLKHYVSTSVLAHTRYTGLARGFTTIQEWGREEGWPLPNVLLRGHVHHYHMCGDSTMSCYVCPCWQAKSKYGARRIDPGPRTIGGIVQIVDGDRMESHLVKIILRSMKPEITVLQ